VKFVSLHSHSTFSYMDGYQSPAAHVSRVAELGMSALALTEHGNVSSHPQLEKAAKKAGIKPIFGLEAYTAIDPGERRKFHLTILAMNQQGYRNLMEIVSSSWRDFYQFPTVSGALLARHHEGLIVLSGCADSLLSCSLLGGKTIPSEEASYGRAVRQAEKFRDLFGDRFYLETQIFPELERTRAINAAWSELGARAGISLVATADVHYPQSDDNEMQVILHAAGRGAGSVAAQEAGWEYDIRLTYPASDRVAYQRLLETGVSRLPAQQALRATGEIAERCEVVLPKAERLRFPLPENAETVATLWEWLREGWRYRVRLGRSSMVRYREEYSARLQYEMERIVSKDYMDYFLMTSDIVRHAKDQGIPVGPARGSAASSLVCYLLRITEVDPMAYPLMDFDRFIAYDRDDIPDIDLDFDDERRGELRAYAVEKYGADRIGNVANYMKFKGKSALEDVGRVFPHIPKYEIETVKSMIIERSGGDSRADAALLDTVEMFPIAKDVFDRYPDLAKAIRLEGNYRGMGINAAGFIISNTPITDICAQYTRTTAGETRTVVSVDKKDAEYLGLMKVDLLSLSTMGMIRIALELAGRTLEDLYAVPMSDPATMKAFQDNDVIGIFQYEGRATRLVNRRVHPDDFAELADINGLSRPGPLFSNTTADYIDVKHGRQKVEKIHPMWDEITRPTKGQIIYQEQVLKALKDIGGLPVQRVGEIRRIISQKLGEAQFNESMKDFVEGAGRVGVPEKAARHMWGRLVTSATYSFNIAHCISYGMLGFWCMWLKVHYPAAFYTAQLRKSAEDAWPLLIKDAQRHGITVRGVDAATSSETWTMIDEATVAAGWIQLPGVGPSKVEAILAFRKTLEITQPKWPMTIHDLPGVKGIGPKMMEKILAIDPVDPFGLLRVGRILDETREEIRTEQLRGLPKPTHFSDEVLDAGGNSRVIFLGMVKTKQYKDWVEDERARTGDSPIDIRKRMDSPNLTTTAILQCYDDRDEDVYLRVSRKIYPKFKKAIEDIHLDRSIIIAIAKRSPNSYGASAYLQQLYVIESED
jgi:Zierdtviridae DNA polymerase